MIIYGETCANDSSIGRHAVGLHTQKNVLSESVTHATWCTTVTAMTSVEALVGSAINPSPHLGGVDALAGF